MHGGAKNILRRGANERLRGGAKYTKYSKININPENFRGARVLVAGLVVVAVYTIPP